jgi:hypothetical protein
MSSTFQKAAIIMLRRGWLCIPLGLDANGLPKRPLSPKWTSLSRDYDTVVSLPWDNAKGLGICLGHQSSNLGVLDIDDVELADQVFETLHGVTRMVRTIRNRLHVYVNEPIATPSAKQTVTYKDRRVIIELKSIGNQVAAPPTQGYRLLNNIRELLTVSMRHLWTEVVASIDDLVTETPEGAPENYPAPWRDFVPALERNNSLYIESHQLREAGIPLKQALNLLTIRCREAYAPGDFNEPEIHRTVESAYTKIITTIQKGSSVDDDARYFS